MEYVLDDDVPGSGVESGFERNAVLAAFPRPRADPAAREDAQRIRLSPQETSFHGMVGRSEVMRQVFAQIRRVGPADTTVTIVGASGTGKELAARALHDLSPRRTEAFVAVNCGAIPANLAEAEFFGYEKGAFTGAQRQHIGHFERAHCGTLFLDEITEMSQELQVKLLRVLETGRIVRVGGTQEIPVDVRVVAATNRDPLQAVQEERLREDVYYRLAVFVLRLPVLRVRGDDVELIAEDLLESLNRKYGTAKSFGPQSIAAMRAAAWPGNVRELRNCVERAFIMSEGIVDIDCQHSDAVRGNPGRTRWLHPRPGRLDGCRCRARNDPRHHQPLRRQQAQGGRVAGCEPEDDLQQAHGLWRSGLRATIGISRVEIRPCAISCAGSPIRSPVTAPARC